MNKVLSNKKTVAIFILPSLILFAVFAVLVVVACIVGVKWRKSKDAKAALAGGSDAGAEE